MNLNIVLVEPEIPQNTGNIVRTCAAIGANLHLVKPFGFEIDDKHLKRAGLDYWDEANITTYENLQEFLDAHPNDELFYITTKAKKYHTDIEYPNSCYLLFGKETKGLPENLLLPNLDRCLRIPMRNSIRSLNLANSVAILAYEVLRQFEFEGLEKINENYF